MRASWVLALLAGGQLWACECVNWPSAKTAWRDAPVVFLGHVDLAEPSADLWRRIFREQSVWVRVEEAFKGAQKGQIFTLSQPSDSCTPTFRTGERAVFYLFPAEKAGTWIAPGCHRSRLVEDGADDLLFLRGLPASANGNRLSGEVELYERSGPEGFHRSAVLPGLKVTASRKDRTPVSTVTNASGVYEFYNLPPGKYRVEIAAPKGLKIDFPMVTGPRLHYSHDAAVNLGPDSGESVGFVLMADTVIAGKVLGPDGKPMEGVCLSTEPLSDKALTSGLSGCTKRDGTYRIESIPPGQYRVVANGDGHVTAREPFPTLYYPGTSDRDKATPVTVTADHAVEGIDFSVPASVKLVRLSGRVQFADGKSAPEAQVIYESKRKGYQESTLTVGDGSFSFSVVAGMEGQIRGEAILWNEAEKCSKTNAAGDLQVQAPFSHTPPLAISGNSDVTNLILVLPSPSCADGGH